MRMHRKPHLDERLSACGKILKIADLSDKNMERSAEVKEYLDFENIFGNSNPVHLEIGCGKGKFIVETAKLNPDINFVAVEKISNVIIDACERTLREGIENVCFLNCAAEVLPKYLKENSVEKLYLNFSNPLPKEGYKKQRLTHTRFLNIYSSFLKKGSLIVQKTDDKDFYLFSLENYKEAGFEIKEVCEDLKNHPVAGDIETEHEKLFKERGKPIFRIVAEVK